MYMFIGKYIACDLIMELIVEPGFRCVQKILPKKNLFYELPQ